MGGTSVIKYIRLLLLLLITSTTLVTNAQTNTVKLNKQVTIYRDATRIDSLLSLFSKQTGIGFSFNSKKISPSRLIAIKKGHHTLGECLLLIKRTAGIHYAVTGNHIIMVDNPPPVKQTLQLPQKAPPSAMPALPASRPVVTNTQPGSRVRKPTSAAPNRSGSLVNRQPGNTIKTDTGNRRSPVHDVPVSAPGEKPNTNRTDTIAALTVSTDSLKSARADIPAVDTTKQVPSANSTTNLTDTARRRTTKAVAKDNKLPPAGNTTKARSSRDRPRREFNLIIGAVGSIAKPDSSFTGIGVEVQAEKFVSEKLSLTLGVGYNYFSRKNNVPVDTFLTRYDTVPLRFSNVPVLAGVRYYFWQPLYAGVEVGVPIGASGGVGTQLAFAPSIGAMLPVGNSKINMALRWMYVNEASSSRWAPAITKGNYSIWSFKLAWAF